MITAWLVLTAKTHKKTNKINIQRSFLADGSVRGYWHKNK